MRTIRRLYFYIVALISLEVVLWGVIGLLRSIFSSRLVNTADALAQALALVLVGLPIFLFHWLWSQRAAMKDDEERSASLRAIFFYAVLLGTLIPVVQNLLALISRLLLGVTKISYSRALMGGYQTWQDNLIAIIINSVVAYYFWVSLKDAWSSLDNECDTFSDVRRLYRYLWLLYSLLMTIFGVQQILRYILYLPVPKYILGTVGQEMFANGLSLLLVGTPLWVYTWGICQDALLAPAERDSNLRLGVLYLLSLGCVITVLTAGGLLLNVILRWVLGESMQGYEFMQEVGGPLSLGIPLAMVWAYYGSWLNKQITSDEVITRREGKQRLYYYILSLLGLAAAFIGVASLLSFIIDLLTFNAFWGDTVMRDRLASSLATLAVGLPLWLMTWRPMQAQAMEESDSGDHSRRSTIRRVYLYLALFAGVIGGMASAVGLVYQVISTLLSGDVGSDFLSRLLNMLQLLVLFITLLVYHLNCLRRDGAQTGESLVARQREAVVLIIYEIPDFMLTIERALKRHVPHVQIHWMPLKSFSSQSAHFSLESAKMVILPVSLALNPPDDLRQWLQSFDGDKLVVDEAVSGWVLTALSPEQAAQATRQVAEGEKVHLSQPSGLWRTIQTVAVVLLGFELLFLLLGLGISFVAR